MGKHTLYLTSGLRAIHVEKLLVPNLFLYVGLKKIPHDSDEKFGTTQFSPDFIFRRLTPPPPASPPRTFRQAPLNQPSRVNAPPSLLKDPPEPVPAGEILRPPLDGRNRGYRTRAARVPPRVPPGAGREETHRRVTPPRGTGRGPCPGFFFAKPEPGTRATCHHLRSMGDEHKTPDEPSGCSLQPTSSSDIRRPSGGREEGLRARYDRLAKELSENRQVRGGITYRILSLTHISNLTLPYYQSLWNRHHHTFRNVDQGYEVANLRPPRATWDTF